MTPACWAASPLQKKENIKGLGATDLNIKGFCLKWCINVLIGVTVQLLYYTVEIGHMHYKKFYLKDREFLISTMLENLQKAKKYEVLLFLYVLFFSRV